MAFIPNEADANWTDQAEPDSVDFDVLLLAHQRTGVQSGCAVTGDGAQNVNVASGVVVLEGKPIDVSAQNDKAVTNADGSNPRFDLISINSSGTAVVTAGTAAAVPVAPEIPASSVPLAFLYVPANDNTHVNTQITDKRVFIAPSGVWYTIAASDASAFEKAGANETVDGTDDHVQINAALAAGYKVVLSKGEFDIGAPIEMASGAFLQGSGWLTVLKANGITTGDRAVIVTENNETRGARVSDLQIEQNYSSGGPCHGINFRNTDMAGDPEVSGSADAANYFVNLLIWGGKPGTTYSGIYLQSSNGHMRECVISECYVYEQGHSNYRIDGASDTLIIGCRGAASLGNGFHIAGGSTRITGCKQFYANAIGFYLGSSRASMSGCEAQDNGEEGVYVAGADCNISDVQIDSNGRLSTSAGIYLGADGGNLSFMMLDRNNTQEYGIQWGSNIDGWNVRGTINADVATPVQGTPGTYNLIAINREGASPIVSGY